MKILEKRELELLASSIERFSRDARFFDMKYPILRRDYLEEYVAVYNQTIVGHDRKLLNLIEKIENPWETFIRYVSKKDKIFILVAT